MFETFGTKYNSYMMQVVIVDGQEYLMKRDGRVYTRATSLPEIIGKDIVTKVQDKAKQDGGWSV